MLVKEAFKEINEKCFFGNLILLKKTDQVQSMTPQDINKRIQFECTP